MYQQHEGNQGFGVADLLSLLRRYALAFVCIPAACGIVAFYWAMAEAPIYKATAMLQLDPVPINPVQAIDDVYDPGYGTSQYYNTQRMLIRSRKLAERLVERLELNEVAEFSEVKQSKLAGLKDLFYSLPFVPPRPPQPEASPAQKLDRAISRTRFATDVALIPYTSLFSISFYSESPELAAKAANALADLYIEELLQSRLDVYQKATRWLTEKLADVTTSLDESQTRLQKYRESENIVYVGGARGLLEDEIRALSGRLRDAERKSRALRNSALQIRQAGDNPESLASVRALLIDPLVNKTANDYLSAMSNVKALEERYGTRHPQMTAARSKLEGIKAEYLNQLEIKASAMEAEHQTALRNERQLAAQLREAEKKLQNQDRKQFDLNVLERDVVSNRSLYDLFLSRFKETETNTSSVDVNARIADPAIPPKGKFLPNTQQRVTFAVTFGLFLTFGLILLRESLRVRIENIEDLEHAADAPVVGVIPQVKQTRKISLPAQLVNDDPKSAFADSIRGVRTSIVLTDRDQPTRCIAICSSTAGEGKTTISTALAAAFATHEKTLIIDADMRRSKLGRMLGIRNKGLPGLSELLAGQADLEECLHSDKKSGLDFILAGGVPANPAALLDSRAFRELLIQLSESYERILFDTAPIGPTTDAIHLTPHVDGVLMIARAEVSDKHHVKACVKRLNQLKTPILGFVLNGAVAEQKGAYGYAAYRY